MNSSELNLILMIIVGIVGVISVMIFTNIACFLIITEVIILSFLNYFGTKIIDKIKHNYKK